MSVARVLLYEPESVGHRRIYLSAFLESWYRHKNDAVLVCALHPDLIRHTETLPPEWRPKITAATTPAVESAAGRFREAKTLAARYSCAEVFFLYGDSYLTAVLGEFPEGPLKFSLLLFRYEVDAAARFSFGRAELGEMVRQRLKALLVRFAANSGNVNKLLFLDPWTVAAFRPVRPERICFVPEPVRGAAAAHRGAGIDKPLRVLLLGTVDARKGLAELCAALERLPSCYRVTLQIVGRVLPEYLSTYELLLGRLRRLGHVELSLKNDPFQEQEIPAILADADVVAVIYGKRHTGMSSVFAWATACRKPVLAVDWGLIGYATAAFGLGYVSRSAQAADLAFALEIAIKDRSTNVAAFEGFLKFMHGFVPAEFLRDYFTADFSETPVVPSGRNKAINVY